MNEIETFEKDNFRVLTTMQLAESFGTDSKILNRNFQRNAERYIQGKHFFALSGEELKQFKGARQIDDNFKFTSVLYLWTEKGAWLLAKSINTNQAWEAYEALVDDYYRIQSQARALNSTEQLKASMRLSLETSEELEQVKEEVTEIRSMVENQITLDHGEQRGLQRAVAARVYKIEKETEVRKRLFSELHREIKDRFAVTSYKDVKRHDLLSAIGYVNAWVPKQK